MSSEEPSLGSIHTAIVRLEGLVSSHIEMTEERMDRHDKRISRHSTEIYGEGNDSSPGMKTKLDRVLESEKQRVDADKSKKTLQNSMIISVIGLILKAGWDFLTHSKGTP